MDLARVQRLSRMPLAEIAGRSRQEISKWRDRVSDAVPSPQGVLIKEAPEVATPQAALDLLRRTAARFFPGVTDEAIPGELNAQHPLYRADLLATAEDLLEGRFDLLGYRRLWFGRPIDWQLDPVRSRRAPSVH